MKKFLAILAAALILSCSAGALATGSKSGDDMTSGAADDGTPVAVTAADQQTGGEVEEFLATGDAATIAGEGWNLTEALDISKAGESGNLTLKTVMPFSAGDDILVKIGSFKGTEASKYESGEIKWVDADPVIKEDGSITVNLDGKVEEGATSVVALIFKK